MIVLNTQRALASDDVEQSGSLDIKLTGMLHVFQITAQLIQQPTERLLLL
jgi:hypothetical protein